MEKLFGSTLNMEIDLEVAKVLIWSSSTSHTHILPSRTINIIKIKKMLDKLFFLWFTKYFGLFALSVLCSLYLSNGRGEEKTKTNLTATPKKMIWKSFQMGTSRDRSYLGQWSNKKKSFWIPIEEDINNF